LNLFFLIILNSKEIKDNPPFILCIPINSPVLIITAILVIWFQSGGAYIHISTVSIPFKPFDPLQKEISF
jgi:hypothetical protein